MLLRGEEPFLKWETAPVIGPKMMTPELYVFVYHGYEKLLMLLMTNMYHLAWQFSATSSHNWWTCD